MAAEEEEDISFELGDRILILGGRHDRLRGRIYYIDSTIIRVLPDGVSNSVVDLPIIDDDIDHSLGIENMYLLQKRTSPAFVTQSDFRVGQLAETFLANGEPGPVFKITEIDEKTDTVVFEDANGEQTTLSFNFTGVPREYWNSFSVIRSRQAPEPVVEVPEAEDEDEELGEDDFIVEEIKEPTEDVFEITEIEPSRRQYTDIIQRNDMLQEFLNTLTDAQKKNPRRLKEIRAIIESCILLRNQVTNYTKDGRPLGLVPTSFDTLGELIENVDIPLARPVLSVKKILQLDNSIMGENPSVIPGKDVIIKYLGDTVKSSVEFQDTQLSGIQEAAITADALPKWYESWEVMNKKYNATWVPTGEGDTVKMKVDREFFRQTLPSADSAEADGLPKIGIEFTVTGENVGNVQFALERGLAARSVRTKQREAEFIVESAEEAAVQNVVLFPLSAANTLGHNRSGRIIYDIANSLYPKKALKDVFEALGGIPEVPTVGSILATGDGGNTQGLIPLRDWLELQPMFLEGLKDAYFLLASYGITERELTTEQQQVLIQKIENSRALIKKAILETRDIATKELAAAQTANAPFLQGPSYQDLLDTLVSEPILAKSIEELRSKIPYYRENDLAITAAILSSMSDLYLAAVAGVAAPLAIERNRVVREQFLDALKDAMKLALKKEMSGDKPIPNRCVHVRALAIVRKIDDDARRMQALAKFITQFNAGRQDNWLQCNTCEQNLLCVHEFLQIQEFIRPREKDVLHKELLLTFSGGQFHGHYMCKNCGQGIEGLSFDRGLEFDDEGRPLAGQGIIVNREDVFDEAMEVIIGTEGTSEEKPEFATETQTIIYNAAKILFEKVGITAELSTYRRIVTRVENEILKQPTRERYDALKKAGKVANVDYDIYLNRILVCSIAANCLIEVQTHIPGYIVRYTLPNCAAGFTGYPMDSEEDLTGVKYMSCAIASVMINSAPWNLTGFQRKTADSVDKIAILVKRLTAAAVQDVGVQQQIIQKRSYLQNKYGKSSLDEKLAESLPYRFLPARVSSDEATGPLAAWMTSADSYAQTSSDAMKGSPYQLASCCYKPIAKPFDFWKDKSLPAIPAKQPLLGIHGSRIYYEFKPRREEALRAEVPENLFYKLFLKICFTGPRVGLPHEPGYDKKCPHCGFVFPVDPFAIIATEPFSKEKSVDKELRKEYDSELSEAIQKGKVALEEQGVALDEEAFQELVDTSHLRTSVKPLDTSRAPKSGLELLAEFARLDPEPFAGWRELMSQTITKIATLTADADEIVVAEAYGALSVKGIEYTEDLKLRIGEEHTTILGNLLQQSPSQIVESLQTYVLLTLQRLINGFKPTSMSVPKQSWMGGNILEDLRGILTNHLEILQRLKKVAKGFALAKSAHAVKCLAAVLKLIQKNLRTPYIPGGQIGLPYLIQAIIMGILDEFANPNTVPRGMVNAGYDIPMSVDADARAPSIILKSCMAHFAAEGMNFTEEQVQYEIERRAQMEREFFTKRAGLKTPEEKQVFLLHQRLGLGEFAVKGRAIRAYDEEQYERDAQHRLAMGYTDEMAGGEAGYEVAQDTEDNF